MKLWILRPINVSTHWEPWYDKYFGFIVSAETEESARKLLKDEEWNREGDECREHCNEEGVYENPWLDPKYTTCIELVPGDKPMIIMEDFHRA